MTREEPDAIEKAIGLLERYSRLLAYSKSSLAKITELEAALELARKALDLADAEIYRARTVDAMQAALAAMPKREEPPA